MKGRDSMMDECEKTDEASDLYFGYDPGGYHPKPKNGVAAVKISREGIITEKPKCDVKRTAREAWDWFESCGKPVALGIDTLLAWSLSSTRKCDANLRKKYSYPVMMQNSLPSSITINGAMIARNAANEGWGLYESHPKLFVAVAGKEWNDEKAVKSVLEYYNKIKAEKDDDDAADAVVAAWCAAQGHSGRWTIDLFAHENDIVRFANGAKYPWKENLELR